MSDTLIANALTCIIHESREQTRSGGILRDVRGA